ncbi:MAG: DUF4810 domain-containing protein [Aquabacterium sp.]
MEACAMMRGRPLLRMAALAIVCASALLQGCANQKPLYAWGGYQGQVYAYLRHQASPEQQILDIEQQLAEASASTAAIPPGMYAHLGLLYLNAGKHEQATQAWTREKELFPESATFIDYLLKNMKKQGA